MGKRDEAGEQSKDERTHGEASVTEVAGVFEASDYKKRQANGPRHRSTKVSLTGAYRQTSVTEFTLPATSLVTRT